MYFQINNTKFNFEKELDKNYKNDNNKNIQIKSYREDYDVIYNNNNPIDLFEEIYKKGDIIIIDKNIYQLYNFNSLKIEKYCFLNDANENNKTIYTSLNIIKLLTENNFNKSNKLIVIGGGITQDVSSFSAAIYKRGIKWIFIPTTLLAMSDSCIGSKSAINHNETKNQLGLFYPPSKIYINKNFLSTLKLKEIKSGLGEIIKLFLIGGEIFLKKLNNLDKFIDLNDLNNLNDLNDLNEILIDFVFDGLLIKKMIIEYDEFDSGERNALNYGHTFGHIIEKLSNYEIPHGIAVFMGMKIINKLNNFNCEYLNKYEKFLVNNYKITNLDKNKFKTLLLNDKKVKNNQISLIILKNYGMIKFKNEIIDNNFLDKIIDLV